MSKVGVSIRFEAGRSFSVLCSEELCLESVGIKMGMSLSFVCYGFGDPISVQEMSRVFSGCYGF